MEETIKKQKTIIIGLLIVILIMGTYIITLLNERSNNEPSISQPGMEQMPSGERPEMNGQAPMMP